MQPPGVTQAGDGGVKREAQSHSSSYWDSEPVRGGRSAGRTEKENYILIKVTSTINKNHHHKNCWVTEQTGIINLVGKCTYQRERQNINQIQC